MLTKNEAKLIKSLGEKKYRKETGLFTVEGEKGVLELLRSDFQVEMVISTEEFFNKYGNQIREKTSRYEILKQSEIEGVSSFETNDSALAVVKQKEKVLPIFSKDEIVLALDDVKDPGNLGTIIRIADWYGVKKIIASENTVDFYNPKVISATMGSFARVNIQYGSLTEILPKIGLPIFGAFLSGTDIHKANFPKGGILVMGSESNGISPELERLVTEKITIPSFGRAESLNVAVATAVILDNWKK